MAANRGPFEDDGGFDNRQRAQYASGSSPGSDGFDGVLPPSAAAAAAVGGFFGGAGAGAGSGSGVELEVLSSTSSHTRNEAVRDRLDQRTASDASSQAGGGGGQHVDQRPLIAGEPLLRGIGEVAAGLPPATAVDEGRHLQRRQRRKQQAGGDGLEDGAGYASYQAPARHRSLVRPERQQQAAAGSGEPSSRARAAAAARARRKQQAGKPRRRRCCPSPWQTYCRCVTVWAPGRVLRCFGMPDTAVQLAWREKMGLVSLILLLMGAIAFLTFGFQQVLCGLSGSQTRIKWNEVGAGYVVVQGRAYDVTRFKHAKPSP
ncbi:Chitin synthase, class 3, partial [Coemansia sp. RSA 1694]